MEKDAGEWTDKDYQAIRRLPGYGDDWDKKRKALDYPYYKKREKMLKNKR